MNCTKCKTLFPDLLLDPRSVSSAAAEDAHQHIKSCSACLTEWTELQAVMQNLEMWNVPEPSPYFETRPAGARFRDSRPGRDESRPPLVRAGMHTVGVP